MNSVVINNTTGFTRQNHDSPRLPQIQAQAFELKWGNRGIGEGKVARVRDCYAWREGSRRLLPIGRKHNELHFRSRATLFPPQSGFKVNESHLALSIACVLAATLAHWWRK